MMASPPLLTRATLAIRRLARGFTTEYVIHQLVADLFPDRPARDYLYRVTRERPGSVEVIVLSTDAPRAIADIPIRSYGAVVRADAKSFAPALRAGQVLDFDLRANFTRSVDGRRTDLWEAARADPAMASAGMSAVYGAALARRLAGVASIGQVGLLERRYITARHGRNPTSAAQFVAVDLRGTLTVQDPNGLLARMAAGLGRAKAFGCGLLCLAPAGMLTRQRHGLTITV